MQSIQITLSRSCEEKYEHRCVRTFPRATLVRKICQIGLALPPVSKEKPRLVAAENGKVFNATTWLFG